MPDLPHLSGREIVRALERLGFVKRRQRGSHVVMARELAQGTIGCVVPLHDEVAVGTLRSVLKQARLSAEDFLTALK
jgi:predicted RNA binding protein YcfA (HicA-like mRNA interferase family)